MSVATNLLSANVSSMETDASGWAPGTNTSVARTTARAYAGVASLQLTASAAGTVRATTSGRVAVTAGAPYLCYAYVANASAATGRTATVTVTWYGAGLAGPLIGSTTSQAVTVPSTGWLTPPPILLATAPATAATATVTVTVTGMSAGSAVSVDAVALGPPALLEGSLLSYNVQGCEVDASGWQPIWNCGVSRTSTRSYEGWWSLTMTATAAGAMRAGTVAAVPVTAGEEYYASAWIYPPAGGTELRAQVRWLDSSGAVLTTSSHPWTGLAASTWTRCVVIDTAPAEATHARVVLEAVATASGQVWTADQIALRPTPVLPGSMIGYAAQSMEAGVSAWTAESGCAVDRSTALAYEGVASLAVTATGGQDAVITLAQDLPVAPRQAYQVVPHVYHAQAEAPVIVDMLFTWKAADGTLITSTFYRWSMAAQGGWYLPRGSGVAPAGAALLTVGMRFLAPAAGDVFYVDEVLVAVGGIAAIPDPIDGVYGAAISVQGLTTGGYTYWGLWRMGPDGALTPVRGPHGDLTQSEITGDIDIAHDFEAPLGVRIRYYLKLWTGSAYAAFTSDSIVIPEPDPTMVVIKDPGQPARQTTAVVATLPDWSRSARQGVNPIRGRARPIVIADVRTSRTGTLTLVTETAADADQLWWVLETGATLLLQWPPFWGERDIYVQVGDVTEAHIVAYAEHGDRTWSLPLTEVDRPIGGIAGSATRTWQTVIDEHADWLAALQSTETWLGVYSGVS
ncbi:hypothetical protein [Streptomyces sp. DH12]|uniref:hypothetical protein n=1 Tax=Streptomyces sp. DH12 TaxID=2857010 RepID=UPI001E2E38D1|nr:hypothetical protein [Streptomyces sp. DH12]